MNHDKIVSGVGVLVYRLGNSVRTIEKWFPIDMSKPPKKFERALYPKYTDTIFMKTIYDLVGKEVPLDILTKSASYNRINNEQREVLLGMTTRDIFNMLEPQFNDHPDIVDSFIEAAKRYTNPLPQFELDLKYGAADLYQPGKLIELKSYSVMSFEDLHHARNQVLAYACLAIHSSKYSNLVINEIEVVNALTNEVWTWDFSEFRKSGEASRLYWSVLIPLLANDNIKDEEISMIKYLYDKGVEGTDVVSRVMYEKHMKMHMLLLRKIYQLKDRLKVEVNARKHIMMKTKYRNGENFKQKGHYNWFFDESEDLDFDHDLFHL